MLNYNFIKQLRMTLKHKFLTNCDNLQIKCKAKYIITLFIKKLIYNDISIVIVLN